MVRIVRASVLMLVALSTGGVANAQWWNPFAADNFQDCVLQGMKGVSGDVAAAAVVSVCRQKFPIYCEVIWTGSTFKKGTKPLIGSYVTYKLTHDAGWKILIHVPSSTVTALGAKSLQFFSSRKEDILQTCR